MRPVHLMPLAERDLRQIAFSIRSRVSLASSIRWIGLIRVAINELAESAEQFPEANESLLLGRDIRERVVGKYRHQYRILFTFTDELVVVHRVRHAAQDILHSDEI